MTSGDKKLVQREWNNEFDGRVHLQAIYFIWQEKGIKQSAIDIMRDKIGPGSSLADDNLVVTT